MIESHIACTETSALVGGSQPPTPSSRFHNPDIGTLASKLEANTNPLITLIVIINFRNTMQTLSNDLNSYIPSDHRHPSYIQRPLRIHPLWANRNDEHTIRPSNASLLVRVVVLMIMMMV